VVLGDALVRLVDPDLRVGSLLRNMNFVSAVLVDPFDGRWLLSWHYSLLALGQRPSLRIDKGVSEDCFLLLELGADFEAMRSVAICVTEGELVEGETEGTLTMLVQPMLVFLQLLDKTGFNLQFWSSRI
jgi:hypothetical protein